MIIIPKKELIERYVNQKLNADKISKKYNCTPHPITKRLREYNIPVRSRGEQNALRLFLTAEKIMENYL